MDDCDYKHYGDFVFETFLNFQPLLLPFNCSYTFQPDWLGPAFSDNLCGQAVYIHCITSCSIAVVLISLFNGFTLRAMHKANQTWDLRKKKIRRKSIYFWHFRRFATAELTEPSTDHRMSRSDVKLAQHRHEVEVTYFKLAVINALAMGVISYVKIKFSNSREKFCRITFLRWCFQHQRRSLFLQCFPCLSRTDQTGLITILID